MIPNYILKVICNEFEKRTVVEMRESPGRVGRDIIASVTLRRGIPFSKKIEEQGRKVYIAVFIDKFETIESNYDVLDVHSREISKSLVNKIFGDAARLEDLQESFWERFKFLFNGKNTKKIKG